MKELLNVKEATQILSEEAITNSEQIVRRWIREGKLKATRTENRKNGYCIFADDLTEFISKRKPEKKWQRFADEEYMKWEKAFFENRKLAEENQRLKTLNQNLEFKITSLNLKIKGLESRINLLKSANKISSNNSNVTNSNIKGLFGNEQETKRIFRKIVAKMHPDSGGDEEIFKKVNEVYKKEFK